MAITSDPDTDGPDSAEEREKQYRRALRRAMDLLAVRAHSIWQLKVKLERKFEPDLVERVLAKLRELNLLDEGGLCPRVCAPASGALSPRTGADCAGIEKKGSR